ncbi:rab GTPase-binding effector protein 1-like [Dendronephthya gigantea]|uniref:rab GTPase-binding effector protein 1-like n=1 Tax=Dendronephthya gigantea TaxID=151771 RepID=UPI00106C984A|nr:rab GTPase-binding effector protein 1-like [Dendronephthya gigantea]
MDEESAVASLQAKVQELETKHDELRSAIETKEQEFGKKRAQFKEIFLQKETELNDEVTKLTIAREENAKLLANLQSVSTERDNLKTAVFISETSNNDELTAMKFKYQEEIASLKAIMHDAVQDTRQEEKEKFEAERMGLVVANQDLEKKVSKYKAQIRELKSKQLQLLPPPQQEDDSGDGLFDVLPWKSAQPSTPEPVADTDENLEDSMKKAQEDAETLRSIVMPLEEEIASLKSKLKNANDKIVVLETKQEKRPVKSNAQQDMSHGSTSEETDEKIKELSQYLEAERSARTDLEMFVAVLNTQKTVLQEDADKLRKELHNVCRLLEQEKEEHLALKDTWGMANDRFLETQRVQKLELDKIKNLLTIEQLKLIGEDPQEKNVSVKLLTPPSPATNKRFLSRKLNKQGANKKDNVRTKTPSSSESKRSLASLVRGPKASSLPSTPSSILDSDIPQFGSSSSPLVPNALHPTVFSDSVDSDSRSLNAFSDDETTLIVNGVKMKKYKSADDLESELAPAATKSPRCRSEELDVLTNENDESKRKKENIDWKSFEEAAKSSLSNDVDRACEMCSNYEKQLQKLQQRNEALSEETAELSKKLKEEQETVTVIKRACDRLEQSVKIASEDAQAQIKVAMDTQRSFESLLDEITADIDKTKKDTSSQLSELMLSRDSLLAKYEQLSENSRSLAKSGGQQRVAQRPQDNVEGVLQTDSKTNEALQSEINFLKDRVVAEGVAKESLEQLYQAEIEELGREIRNLKSKLAQQSNKQPSDSRSHDTYSNEVITILEKQLQNSTKENDNLVNDVKQLKAQLHSLNSQLNNSEAVQRDFVQLSQSLQVKLEEMKESQKEIKWEHEDDVSSCRKCEKPLDVPQDKHHCRQCGRIFCDNCTKQTLSTHSSQLPLRLCTDCGTTEKIQNVPSGENIDKSTDMDDT